MVPAPRLVPHLGLLGLQLCALGLGLSACSETSPRIAAAEARAAQVSAAAARPSARAARRDPELAEVRAALERGRPDIALALLEKRGQGFEAACLRARAEHLRGEPVAALAALERARELDPGDPELLGTEVELLVALERRQSASEKLAAAFQRCGPEPALLRAQGLVELRTEGRARVALEALERARARDPELPFLRWPLAQAHLLVGRSRLEAAPAEATAHARAAQALWPDPDSISVEARELEAEGLVGELRFEEALAIYAELEGLGLRFGETPAILHQRCATSHLVAQRREAAVEHYLAARRLGMDDEGLGFGALVLTEERRALLDRGLSAAEGGDWAAAELDFARALELRPGDLEAENHLAVACFQRADYAAAAAAWERVLAEATRTGLELPDPVPLNLAKAWRLAGDRERARSVLSELVDREPEGELSAEARELLLVLEVEELAGR